MERSIDQTEGMPLQDLIDEAHVDLIEKRKKDKQPRDYVMSAYQTSHEAFAPLYRKLAE